MPFEKTLPTIKSNETVALSLNEIPALLKNKNNTEMVIALQKYGPVRVIPPPNEFSGRSLNEMTKLTIMTKINGPEGMQDCVINIDGKTATVESGKEKTSFVIRDEASGSADLDKNTGQIPLTIEEREQILKKSTFEEQATTTKWFIEGNSASPFTPEKSITATVHDIKKATLLENLVNANSINYNEFNVIHFKGKELDTANKLAEEGRVTGNLTPYIDFIKSKGLYDQFVEFVTNELLKMAGLGSSSKTGDTEASTGLQQQIFLDQWFNKLAEMVQEREKKAAGKDD